MQVWLRSSYLRESVTGLQPKERKEKAAVLEDNAAQRIRYHRNRGDAELSFFLEGFRGCKKMEIRCSPACFLPLNKSANIVLFLCEPGKLIKAGYRVLKVETYSSFLFR